MNTINLLIHLTNAREVAVMIRKWEYICHIYIYMHKIIGWDIIRKNKSVNNSSRPERIEASLIEINNVKEKSAKGGTKLRFLLYRLS